MWCCPYFSIWQPTHLIPWLTASQWHHPLSLLCIAIPWQTGSKWHSSFLYQTVTWQPTASEHSVIFFCQVVMSHFIPWPTGCECCYLLLPLSLIMCPTVCETLSFVLPNITLHDQQEVSDSSLLTISSHFSWLIGSKWNCSTSFHIEDYSLISVWTPPLVWRATKGLDFIFQNCQCYLCSCDIQLTDPWPANGLPDPSW